MAESAVSTNETLDQIEDKRDDILSREQEAVDVVTKKRDTAIGTATREIGEIQKRTNAVKEPEPFDYRNIKPPHHELARDFMIKSAILMAVTFVGAAYMRVGANGAMMGLAAALKGLQEGDKARYDKEMTQYEHTIKMMSQEYDRRQKHYNTIIRDSSKSVQEKEHEIRLAHLAYGEDYKEAIRPFGEQLKALDRQERMILRLKGTIAKPRDSRVAEKKNYDTIATQEAGKSGISVSEWQELPGNSYQEMLAGGRLKSPSGGKKKGSSRLDGGTTKTPAQWVAEVRQKHPDWTPEKVAEEAKRLAGA